MAPAVLAAWSSGAVDPAGAPGRPRGGRRGRAGSSVKARSSPASPSATGRCVQTPSSCSAGSAAHRGHDGAQVLGRRAHPVHARVDLDVDGDRAARPRRAAAPKAAIALGGVQRRREAVGERRGRRGGVALAQQEHRRRDAVLAQLHPLVDQRDGEPAGAAGQRGPGHRRPAVAVAVGLDHRAQLGRRGQAGQHRRVVRHRGQVDLGPGRARAALGHRHLARRRPPGPGPPAAPARPSGSIRTVRLRPAPTAARATSPGRSPATRPSAGPSDAARPCTWAATRRRLVAAAARGRRRRR